MGLPMADPIVLTHSDIQNYLRCRRMFKWSVVDDWTKEDSLTGALALGTRVHAAIEGFHRTGVDPVEIHNDLAQAARTKADAGPDWLRDQLESDLLVGHNCVVAYRAWVLTEKPYDDYDVIGIEEIVTTEVLGGRAILQGKVDLLLKHRGNGLVLMEDFKTMAATRANQAQDYVLRTYQHPWYANALTAMGHKVNGARYIHLKKVKDLSRTTDPVIVTPAPAMARTSRVTLGYIEEIVAEILGLIARGDETGWYPTPADSCSWCIYRNPCLLAGEGRGAERMALADQFSHGTRLNRYVTIEEP